MKTNQHRWQGEESQTARDHSHENRPRRRKWNGNTFTERQCAATLVRLARDATCRADGHSVYLVLSGSGIVHDVTYRQYTALRLDEDERADIVAPDETERVRLVLPALAGLQAQRTMQVEAANSAQEKSRKTRKITEK